ncbi:tryptophan--tRNA ligase, mitochondrial isoform X2 [Nematostella vectensis]|uniref:tryptophan--tRNA ligase, mitochondrial isoform X2 n=1 Tax=Nematostella vectensis TaxID=45351 RepID=UPI00138FA498|nr:tryptophan--tRNA ligase, mitochondrial isoform X2 [Nematostella vectensis]
MRKPKCIFSGIQPTGAMHLGNFLGAIQSWVSMQHESEARVIYSITDLHSITVPQEPSVLKQSVLNMATSLLASGVNPDRCILFQQSQVSQHAELAWVLSCLAPTGNLSRMHQWKSKTNQTKARTCLGLYAYPVLMAADILLYRATHVPIGEDQLQHLELTRELARIYNQTYGNFFMQPHAILGSTQRVMSLRDPTKKMSKSDPVPSSRIELTDTADQIAAKIRRAVTDSEPYICYDPGTRPGLSNLIRVYAALSNESPEAISVRYQDTEHSKARFKQQLTDLVIHTLQPIRENIQSLSKDPGLVSNVLETGAEKARLLAEETLVQVRRAVGLR